MKCKREIEKILISRFFECFLADKALDKLQNVFYFLYFIVFTFIFFLLFYNLNILYSLNISTLHNNNVLLSVCPCSLQSRAPRRLQIVIYVYINSVHVQSLSVILICFLFSVSNAYIRRYYVTFCI